MKKVFFIGCVFGLIAPVVGLFLGLQVSVLLGNILTFPLIILSQIIGEPFGFWSGVMRACGFVLSMLVWGGFFVGVKAYAIK